MSSPRRGRPPRHGRRQPAVSQPPTGTRPPPRRAAAADRSLGGEQVEGRRAVRELLVAGRRRVHEVWVSAGTERSVPVAEIADLAARLGVPVRSVARARSL